MKIGFIGLGKMGYHMVEHLLGKGHRVVVYNRSPQKTEKISRESGAIPAKSYEDLINKLKAPRILWLMVPHSSVEEIIGLLSGLLEPGDLLIDGGNSNYRETRRRAIELGSKGIHFMDAGVSGGLAAAKTGYCIMAGGPEDQFRRVEPMIRDMCVKNGYGHFGPAGAGHYVKMIHNAIEYGMMQAIGEGLDLIKNGPFPDTDLLKLSDVWNHGSIIRSFLMEMTHLGLKHHPDLSDIDGFVPNSGEGRWAVEDAKEYGVDVPVIEESLRIRLASDKVKTFATKAVAVMRDEFGGHGVLQK
ncbi:MAG: decarboxylating 6-phosphogluconate dehydrogenase [Candidatus Marinimicrobia bacterium]|jgi:6-phosphogluconate dehydrogenase|nr:decarboxylating 6-phosphogluconate dehydrogenase [Candidatus Neomarinimicrobiota bacterium]MDD4961333.1 decarboxylating 6-phosphogluconate dehydrogenase [Candidatus Neomarinimicrobiota bacterium]MDD5709758.1 decarboxylating 6-phosphogluconate dehydrogenase [Candidatus Neomarinimicrobiota bacterium]MDX9777147.1 decarboxylating 6-phosphogluconate dehydrogenase [bacterium]